LKHESHRHIARFVGLVDQEIGADLQRAGGVLKTAGAGFDVAEIVLVRQGQPEQFLGPQPFFVGGVKINPDRLDVFQVGLILNRNLAEPAGLQFKGVDHAVCPARKMSAENSRKSGVG
jgi:hypothetical protein